MTGQGDYLIVARSFTSHWMAWRGGFYKWGPFGREMRFSTQQEAEAHLKDARRDAGDQNSESGNAVYVGRVSSQEYKPLADIVYHDGKEITVDFTDDNLSPRQMWELGVL